MTITTNDNNGNTGNDNKNDGDSKFCHFVILSFSFLDTEAVIMIIVIKMIRLVTQITIVIAMVK